MRALTACFTVVLGLGVAAIAACSSTASDTGSAGAGGTSAGGTSAGGTSAAGASAAGTAGTAPGAAGDNGAAGASSGCPALDNGCQDCVVSMCAAEEAACAGDTTGTDNCSDALGTFLFCVCSTDMTPLQCTDTFSATNAKAKAVADCSKAQCKTVCNL